MAEHAHSTTAPSRRALFGLAIGAGLLPNSDPTAPPSPSPWAEYEADLARSHIQWWRRIRLCNDRQEAAHAAWEAEGRVGGLVRLSELEERTGVNRPECDLDDAAQRIHEIATAVVSRTDMDGPAMRVRTILAVINSYEIGKEAVELMSLLLLLAEASGVADLPWLTEEIGALRQQLAKQVGERAQAQAA